MPKFDGRIEAKEDERVVLALKALAKDKGTDHSALVREGVRDLLRKNNRMPPLILAGITFFAGSLAFGKGAVSLLGIGTGNETFLDSGPGSGGILFVLLGMLLWHVALVLSAKGMPKKAIF